MLHSKGTYGCNKSDFGDKRLDKRLNILIENLADKPNVSVTQAMTDWGQTKSCYRFWSNEKVNPDKILSHHIKETVESVSKHKVILCIQDTTDLNYSNLKKTLGLGYLESIKQHGIKLHTCITVSTDGLLIGIIWHRQWVRDPKEFGKKTLRKSKSIKEKESQRWLDCHNEVNQLIPQDTAVIHITDREGDIYELLSATRAPNQYLLLRFAQDRRVEGEKQRIKGLLDTSQVLGKYTVQIGRRGNELPKAVELNVKYKEVKILAPANRKSGEVPATTTLTAIKVYEETEGVKEPIVWYLLSTLPVKSIEDVQEQVKYYTMRWLIERYHFTLKSGCQVEELQLETGESLENAIATYSMVAYRIMYMAYLSRKDPDCDARFILSEAEIAALKLKYNKEYSGELITVKMAVLWIARIGGYTGNKRNGTPGLKTLWRGLCALYYLVEGYQLASLFFANLSKNDLSSSP
jgi:hypothetical protein